MTSDVLASAAAGLAQVVAWPSFGLMLAGVALGFVVGLLPGLGGPTALALLLPLTISLEPAAAFAMLIGVAAVTSTAGDLTSIVLGVPGEATAAAVVLDGHAMARRGEAARAAGAAMGASFLGGIVGMLALMLALPLVYPLIRAIQSPELAALAAAGMCLAAPLSGGSWIRVVVSACVGILLATVGLDPRFGAERLTFGRSYLVDGVGLMSVALGLFAVPELIALGSAAGAPAPTNGSTREQLRRGWAEAFRHPGLVMRSALIGSGVGIVPGVGASVSQWLAYAHAARSVKGAPPLGAGHIAGVVAPCAATNATLGGALVPAVALGIPGSLSTTLLLGALVLKGLTPGAGLLTPDSQGGQLSLVFSFIWLLLFTTVLSAGLGLVSLAWLARVARVPGRFLFPVVASFVLLGAFAERFSAADVVIVAVLGALGWVMARCDWPRAPLVMGLVLGPLLERRTVVSTELHGAWWLLRPGVLLVLLALLAGGARLASVRRRGQGSGDTRRIRVQRSEAALVLAFAGVAVTTLLATWSLAWEAALLPRVAAVTCLPLLAWKAAELARHRHAAAPSTLRGVLNLRGSALRRAMRSLTWLFALVASVGLLGFVAGSAAWSLLYLRASGPVSWGRSVALAGGIAAVTGLVLRAMNASNAGGWLWSIH